MRKALQQVEQKLDCIYDLQKQHIASFGSDDLPDLEQQSGERRCEVDRLIKQVGQLVEAAEKSGGEEKEVRAVLLGFQDRVTLLLEQNRSLEEKVAAVRDRLKKQMTTVSKGKKTISSYRSSAAVSNTPRVISITTY